MASATLKASQDARLNALRNKHEALSSKVHEAQRSPGMPDDMIQLLKKQKLMVKEKIERIRAQETMERVGHMPFKVSQA